MKTYGPFSPATETEARERFELAGKAAQTVVRETAKAMDFDQEEYTNRITPTVVETARDALFAAFLQVTVGSRDEFDSWLADQQFEVIMIGSENVDHVAWHTAPFTNEVIAATFQNEEEAAVETLRRQVVGRLYRERFA